MTEHPEMRSTVFGQVLAELLEKRGMEVTSKGVTKLAEDAGLEGQKVIGRMADAGNEPPGYLDGLVEVLELSKPERDELALAYAMEQRREPPLTPQAEERLRRLLARCDALSNAIGAVLEESVPSAEMKAQTLATLEAMQEEANEAFRRYKQEVGISSPTA